jgi:hypothetical protein
MEQLSNQSIYTTAAKPLPSPSLRRANWVFRGYISAARNERYTPIEYTLEIQRREAESGWTEPETLTLQWDEDKQIAKVAYQVWGLTASQQFERGIIRQPGFIENLIICSELRRIYGDLSDIPGFDRNGNLERYPYDDMLVPVREDGRIVRLKGYSSRLLLKEWEREQISHSASVKTVEAK